MHPVWQKSCQPTEGGNWRFFLRERAIRASIFVVTPHFECGETAQAEPRLISGSIRPE
jgi:hypothetical protein